MGRTIADALLQNASPDKLHISGRLRDGSSCVVTWARGHLLTLAQPKEHNPNWEKWDLAQIPFLPKSFIDTPIKEVKSKKYANSATAQDVLKHICRLIQQLDKDGEVINACDAGREGDLIFTKILKYSGAQPAKVSRLWIQSTLKEAIQEAYDKRKPASAYAGLTQSAYTRDRSDWLWGMNLTRLTTLKLADKRQILPVGRVQTPTLGMIVHRELTRKNFVPVNYYTLVAQFPSGIGDLDMAYLMKQPNKETELGKSPDYAADTKAFWDKQKCEAYAKYLNNLGMYTIKDSEKEESQKPPMPFDLPSLQTDCNRAYGWTAANTLKYLQALYDQGYVTYPRTDCKYFPEDMAGKIYKISQDVISGVAEFHGAKPILKPIKAPSCFNSARVTDHFAIIPTGKMQGVDKLREGEKTLFTLYLHICRRLLQCLDAPAIYRVVTRTWTAKANKDITFTQSSKKLSSLGWKRWQKKESDKEESELIAPKGTEEKPDLVSTVSHVTKAPPSYSEGAIIAAMESVGNNMNAELLNEMSEKDAEKLLKNKGIGTAATRHEVIEKLVSAKYVTREKKNLIPTELGYKLVEQLESIDPLLTAPEQTALWEQRLSEMEQGKGSFREFILALYNELVRIKKVFDEKIKSIASHGTPLQESDTLCPVSGKPMLIHEKFYISPAFPKIPLWKTLGGKSMILYDWTRVLAAFNQKKRFIMHGFQGKFGEYSASIDLDTANNKVVVFPVRENR